MNNMLGYLRNYKRESVLAPLFKMLEATFDLFVPLVMADIVNVGIAAHDLHYILVRCGILLVLAVIGLGGLLGGVSGVASLGRVCRPGKIEAAGPATGLAGSFIHRDLGAGLCQRHRCGHAGPAATDDGYVQRICQGYCLAARHKASCSACRLGCMGAWQRRLTSRCASRLPALAA